MFYSGSINNAMEEVQRTARPLFVFVVPADSNAPFGIADVFNWCAVGHYHLTGIVHIVTEGTTDFEQLNAVTPQKQVPRVHIIPHQPSTQLPPTCLFGSGITFEHVSSMVAMAGRPAESAVNAWEAELIQEGNRVTAEGNRTKRSQGQTMTAIEKEEAAAKSLRVSLRMAGAASPPSSSSSSPVTFAPSVVVARDDLYAEAKRLAKGKAFHVSCGSSSATTPEEVGKMTLFNNAVVYVHIDEVAEEPVKAVKTAPKVASPPSAAAATTPVGKRDRAESDPPTSSSAASSSPTTAAAPPSGDDVLSIRITEGSGKQHNWDLPASTTVEQLFSRARADILGGSSEVFNLVIAYPARRLGASDFAQVLGAGGLGLRGRGAMRLVPVVTAKPAEQHADPNAEGGATQQGRFGAMASMVGGWLGGRTVAQPQPPRPAAPIPTRMNMGDIRRNAAEKEEEEAKKRDDKTHYFNGVSTEFEGPPKKDDDDEKE